MKTKNAKSKQSKRTKVRSSRIVSSLTEERILQLSNDLSENIASGTVKDWRGVALYYRDQLDQAHNAINVVRPSVAALVLGNQCLLHAQNELAAWLKQVKS